MRRDGSRDSEKRDEIVCHRGSAKVGRGFTTLLVLLDAQTESVFTLRMNLFAFTVILHFQRFFFPRKHITN